FCGMEMRMVKLILPSAKILPNLRWCKISEDLTESSSTFGDTRSGSENCVAASFDDTEVEFQMWEITVHPRQCVMQFSQVAMG
ncbi:hypothetical protein L195_g062978, partial [Trifolium pratense]